MPRRCSRVEERETAKEREILRREEAKREGEREGEREREREREIERRSVGVRGERLFFLS